MTFIKSSLQHYFHRLGGKN